MAQKRILAHDTVGAIDRMPAALKRYGKRAAIAVGPDGYLLYLGNQELPELSHLNRIGLGCPSENVIRILGENGDTRLANERHWPVLQHGEIEFFSGRCQPLRQALDHLGVNYQLPPWKVCRLANAKDAFQQLMGACFTKNGHGFKQVSSGIKGLSVPQGGIARPADVPALVRHLLSLGITKVRVKPTSQASCLGQLNVTNPIDPRLRQLDDELYVVQEFIPHDLDVSVPFVIYPGGVSEIYGIFGQHIVHDGEETDFVGSYTLKKRLSSKIYKAIMCATKKAIERLKRQGFYGRGGADFMINTKTRTVSMAEIDGRVTATYYPIMASLRLYGKVAAFDNRNFVIPQGFAFGDLLAHFDGLLLDSKNRVGVVPYNFLPEQGTCYLATFAPNPDQLAPLREQVAIRALELLA